MREWETTVEPGNVSHGNGGLESSTLLERSYPVERRGTVWKPGGFSVKPVRPVSRLETPVENMPEGLARVNPGKEKKKEKKKKKKIKTAKGNFCFDEARSSILDESNREREP